MNIHEYQAKELLAKFGVGIPAGIAAMTVAEAVAAAKQLPGPLWVVKAQIHAGGRGKGKFKEPAAGEKGGVRLARSIDEVKLFAGQMLGNTLVTIQTGPAGKQVNRLYIEDGSDIEKEFYLSALVDRAAGRLTVFTTLSRPGADWRGPRGHLTGHVLAALPGLVQPTFYLCGNGAMTRELKAELIARGVERKRQIRTEAFFD
jgi:succinyl-CoA synthetase beta subunit